MNKKVILTTVATIVAIATAGGVKADEFNGDLAKDSIGLTAQAGNSTSGTEATVSSAQGEHTQEILEVSKEIEQLTKKIQAEEAMQEVLQKMGTLSE